MFDCYYLIEAEPGPNPNINAIKLIFRQSQCATRKYVASHWLIHTLAALL
jgi:hypothetical protein